MQPQDFLAAVLPSSGLYCTAELSTKKRQHIFVGDLNGLEESIQQFETQEKNTYFALASFSTSGSREAANACAMRSIFIDLDVGTGEKTYPTKRAAVEALDTFMHASALDTLGSPWIVDSGGGVHAYWPLDHDATIPEWKPVAEAFKRSAKEHHFRIDMTVTADAARVLRPPGTTNHKYDPPRPVVLRNRGDTFSLDAMAKKLGLTLPAVPPPMNEAPLILPGKPPKPLAKAPSAAMLALTQNNITLFKNILVKTAAGRGCGQVAYYKEHATEDGLEPLWRGLLSIAQKCTDGEKAARILSAMHPYDPDRMLQKLREIKGPYACTKLDTENPGVCIDCPHWGKITNPLILGRDVAVDNVEKLYEAPSGLGKALKRPELPFPYAFGVQGGVYRKKKAEEMVEGGDNKPVQILPFDFFMVDMLQEGTSYRSRFAAVRPKSTVFVTLHNNMVGKKDEVIKTLAGQNIIAAYGAGNDKNLHDYVRVCIGNASAADTSLRVPPNLGWQPDSGFAISDQVLLPHGQSYTYVSDRLNNIINVTSTKGTLGDWQRVMHMMQTKELWGPVMFAAIGFGSPLMQWVDDGTPGMTFLACGKQSGIGKTLALSLCASVWGHPTHYLVVPSTSNTTMLQRAGLLGNCPLVIDELTNKSHTSDREWMPNFVFDYSQGGHKLKGSNSANAELDNTLIWRALAALSANTPEMEHMMGARDTTSEGEVRRMLEWHATDKLQWTDAEREVKGLLGQNYGVAGRAYAQWLVEHVDVAKEVLADTQRRWRRLMSAEDSERFWTAGCGATLTGAILAGPKYANVFDFDVAALSKMLQKLVISARSIIGANQQSAEDILNAYTREFHGQFVKVGTDPHGMVIFGDGRSVSHDSAKGKVAGRVEYDIKAGYVDYFVEFSMLKRYCASRNWSFQDLREQLTKTPGLAVTDGRKDLLALTKSPPMRVMCLCITRLIRESDEKELAANGVT